MPQPRNDDRQGRCPGHRPAPRLSVVFAFVCASLASAAPGAGASEVRLATGSEGGSFFRIGRELVRFWAGADPDLRVTLLTTGGSNENLRLLAGDEADLALVTHDAINAFANSASADDEGTDDARRPFCLVGPLYVGAAQFVVRREKVRTGTLADLEGLVLYPGARGSGTEDGTLSIMRALDIRPRYVPAEDRTLGYGEAAAALAEGRFEAATLSGGLPVKAVSDLFEEHPGEFRILTFTPDQQAAAIENVPGLVASSVPPGTYAGQPNGARSVGKRTLLIARTALDSGVAARLGGLIERALAARSDTARTETPLPALGGLDVAFWNQPLDLPRCGE